MGTPAEDKLLFRLCEEWQRAEMVKRGAYCKGIPLDEMRIFMAGVQAGLNHIKQEAALRAE